MAEIKTREKVKDIKVLDKAAVAGERMKQAFVRSKDQAENLLDDGQVSPSEYAEDKIRYAAENVAEDVGHDVSGQAKKAIDKGKDAIREHREEKRIQKAEERVKRYEEQLRNNPQEAARRAAQKKAEVKRTASRHQRNQTIKTAKQTEKTIKQTARSTGKATVKTAKGTVKSTEKAVKTADKTAKMTIKTALVAAIAAGGWVAVVIVVVICLIALIVGSCFGIFFSSEDTGSDKTMKQVVQEINDDYQNRLEAIKSSVSYDELEMSGSRAVWPEVLSVYAVKTTTDPDNPQEVATITPEKEQLLKDLFWEMNTIDHHTETKSETVIIESDDGNGNILEERVTETRTTLYITVSHKTADEMSLQYSFNDDQNEQLALLLEQDSSMWAAVLYGIYGSDDQIVAVALAQVGNIGGQPYWSWYGFNSRVEWCACFVSWCANECGYIDTGVCPKYAGCVNGVDWFKSHNQWLDGSAEPAPGMIIFYDWDSPNGESGPQDGLSDHTGIVWKVEDGYVYTIEGNLSDSCKTSKRPVGEYQILGYGVLNP